MNRILIVDDEPNVRLMFRTTLESAGGVVTEAEGGAIALDRRREADFDMILLDLRMPEPDGMETLRRLRAQGDDTPVVILTAHGSVPDAVEAMKLGAVDFLSKPITPEALRRIVAEVCDRGRISRTAATSPTAPAREGPPDEASGRRVTSAGEFAENLAKAKRAINLRDFHAAEVHLKQALALHVRSAEAHNLMGVLLELRGEHHGSYRAYRAALKADPRHEAARHNMTRYYERHTFGASEVPIDVGDV